MSISLLILDDEDLIRESLKDYFEDMDWDVVAFASAEEALVHIHSFELDYITVDLRLPGINGVDFILQAHTLQPHTRFVIYTGSINFALNDDLRQIGITEENLIHKPVLEMHEIYLALVRQNPEMNSLAE